MKRVQMLSFRTKNEIGAVKHTKLFRVRVYILINTVNRAVTTIPLDKVNSHFSDRININYDF